MAVKAAAGAMSVAEALGAAVTDDSAADALFRISLHVELMLPLTEVGSTLNVVAPVFDEPDASAVDAVGEAGAADEEGAIEETNSVDKEEAIEEADLADSVSMDDTEEDDDWLVAVETGSSTAVDKDAAVLASAVGSVQLAVVCGLIEGAES